MLIDFDQNTIANMTAALEYVCKNIPARKDNHEARKRIADAMIAAAKVGNLGYFTGWTRSAGLLGLTGADLSV